MGAIASQITSLTIGYSTVYSSVDQRKYQRSALLAFVWGIHRWPVNSPHKWPVTWIMFPFDDVIMIIENVIDVTKCLQWLCKCTTENTKIKCVEKILAQRFMSHFLMSSESTSLFIILKLQNCNTNTIQKPIKFVHTEVSPNSTLLWPFEHHYDVVVN